MPRTARLVMDGGTYHVLTRGNNRQTVFHDAEDFQRYLQLLSSYAQEFQLLVYHFVLMPNHVHLVLEAVHGEMLSKAMLGLNLTYALYYRRRYEYSGHLWQGRFKSLLIDRDSYLLACGRYVELNPVRAQVTEDPGSYFWSSYRTYAAGIPNPLLARHPLYDALGTTPQVRQQRYRAFVLLGMQTPQPTNLTRYHFIAGTPDTLKTFEKQFGIIAARRTRGRPRKCHDAR